jgi:hypothetical protein
MTATNYTDITILLDRSGSMQSCQEGTIEAINAYIIDQRKQPGKCNLSLYQFDDRYEINYEGVPINSAVLLNKFNYQPRGCTALVAAMGLAIDNTGKRLAEMPEDERPSQVLFVTITDGYENASYHVEWNRGYNKAIVKQKVDHQKDSYKWQFVYLGANQDAILVGSEYGNSSDSSLNFTSDDKGMRTAGAVLSGATNKYRYIGRPTSANFFGGQVNADVEAKNLVEAEKKLQDALASAAK